MYCCTVCLCLWCTAAAAAVACLANGNHDWQSSSHPELPQLKLKKIGCHDMKRKVQEGWRRQKKQKFFQKLKLEKAGRHSRIRKSTPPVKNEEVRRVKISLTETKQGSALKTFPCWKKQRCDEIAQKTISCISSLLLFPLARHQLCNLKNLGWIWF